MKLFKDSMTDEKSETNDILRLSDLEPNESGIVERLCETGAIRRRIIDMGITPGVEIKVVKLAPFGDPMEISVRGYELSIRKSEASEIYLSRKVREKK